MPPPTLFTAPKRQSDTIHPTLCTCCYRAHCWRRCVRCQRSLITTVTISQRRLLFCCPLRLCCPPVHQHTASVWASHLRYLHTDKETRKIGPYLYFLAYSIYNWSSTIFFFTWCFSSLKPVLVYRSLKTNLPWFNPWQLKDKPGLGLWSVPMFNSDYLLIWGVCRSTLVTTCRLIGATLTFSKMFDI